MAEYQTCQNLLVEDDPPRLNTFEQNLCGDVFPRLSGMISASDELLFLACTSCSLFFQTIVQIVAINSLCRTAKGGT